MVLEETLTTFILNDVALRFIFSIFLLCMIVGLIFLTYRFLSYEKGNKQWLDLSTFDKISFCTLFGGICFIPLFIIMTVYSLLYYVVAPLTELITRSNIADIDSATANWQNAGIGILAIILLTAYPFIANKHIKSRDNCFNLLKDIINREGIRKFVIYLTPGVFFIFGIILKDSFHLAFGSGLYAVIFFILSFRHFSKVLKKNKNKNSEN